MNNEKCLVVISGPSGCGKNTVVDELQKLHPEIEQTISATSRAKRQGESDGVDYFYLTKEQFIEKLNHNEILEHTNYCGNYYGTLKSEVDDRMKKNITTILIIEVEGACNIKKIYPNSKSIFVVPPSMEILEDRLRNRNTDDEEDIQKRLLTAKKEMTFADNYDYQIVNDDLTECAKAIYDIIKL